jgi:hypothetical protein
MGTITVLPVSRLIILSIRIRFPNNVIVCLLLNGKGRGINRPRPKTKKAAGFFLPAAITFIKNNLHRLGAPQAE